MTGTRKPSAIGIVTALEFEAKALGRSSCFTIHRCGASSAGIEAGIRDLSGHGCNPIVSWGTAGALAPPLEAGQLFLPDRVLSRDGREIPTDRSWRERLKAAIGDACTTATGVLLDSPRIVARADDKHELAAHTGASAVDMESGPVGAACAAAGLPFVVVRAIIDEPDDRLPEGLRGYLNDDGSIRTRALLADLSGRPGDWAALLRLARRYVLAGKTLRTAAGALRRCASERP